MMKQECKTHLLYMTGLSVDKNRMNNITENINFDKDYTFLLNKAQKNLKGMFEKKNRYLSRVVDGVEGIVDRYIDALNIIPDITIIAKDSIFSIFQSAGNEKIEATVTEKLKNSIIKPAIEKPFELIGYKNIDILKDHESLKQLLNQYTGSCNNYTNGDFFSLYMANQSDSIGLEPLSKLSDRLSFNIEHSYCDWDYYDNKYIDHVILKVDTKNLKDNWYIELSKTFNIHVNDILLSKIIVDEKVFKSKSESNKKLSLMDLILGNNDRYSKADILKTLSDRNFFGISLLSQVLYTIQKLSKDNEVFDIDNMEDIDNLGSGQYHFLKELLEMASDPNMSIKEAQDSRDKSLVGAKIYFSDGIKLTKSLDDLVNDEFFLYTNRADNKTDPSLINESKDKEFLKEQIGKNGIHTISHKSREDKNLINYIYSGESDNYAYIKVPIKMMISLPLDSNEKVDSELYLPSCLVDGKEKVIDILTVGGAEHNRALSHLINKHRFRYKDERLFGFMDNYFDFEHKMKLDDNRNGFNDSFNFFMGINQPVSGWNYLLTRRENDTDGNSVNSDVKFITFKLEDKERRINVVSIYGFSAIASVLGINLFIEEIRHHKINYEKGIFSSNFASFFSPEKINNDRGTTATVFFYKNLKDIYELKDASGSLYDKLQITLKNFEEDEKKLLRNKLGEDISKLIVEVPDKQKYNLIIDAGFKNKEEKWILRDKLNTLELQDIKLGSIKSVVRFFFDNKCYLSVFNNDLQKYSEVLYYDNGKNHLLISGIQRGRVGAIN